MRRRAQGEGSLYFDSNRGRWVGQASAGVSPATGNRRRLKVVGTPGESKADVARRLADRIAELSVGGSPDTVGDLVSQWLARGVKRKSATSLDTARRLVNSHVLPRFGSVNVNSVTVEDVEAWMDGMASAGLARTTIAKIRSQLAQAFDFGLKRRHVSWNPARLAELPTSTAPAREGRSLTASEARALLNVSGDHRLGAWVVTAITLGLRPGEASGLSWPDVDLDEGVVVVHRSLSWLGNTPVVKATKTKKPRTLDLPSRTVDALADHRKRQVEERLLMGDRWPVEWSDLVFVSEAGTPLIPSNLRRLISTLASDAGIEGTVTPYSLRHTSTSLLSASGVAPEVLADLLGHRDTRMVHKHYRHPVTPSIRVARDRIEDALGQ